MLPLSTWCYCYINLFSVFTQSTKYPDQCPLFAQRKLKVLLVLTVAVDGLSNECVSLRCKEGFGGGFVTIDCCCW